MQKKIILAIVLVALTAILPWLFGEQTVRAGALPPEDIITTVRGLGMNPTSKPERRGPYYVLHAYDPSGNEMRVVADARFGDVLSIVPVNALADIYAPRYDNGPRIIHVPQNPAPRASALPADERSNASARYPSSDDETYGPGDAVVMAPPHVPSSSRPWEQPRKKPYSLSEPAPQRTTRAEPLDEGPTPVKPTPRWSASTERFKSRDEQIAAPIPPSDPAAAEDRTHRAVRQIEIPRAEPNPAPLR